MSIYQLGDLTPEIAADVFIADSASVIGNVELRSGSSVWFGVTIRADNERMIIGEGSNVQDGSVLHSDPGYPLTLGAGVTIGHQVMLHGCTIGDGALIGMQAVILNGARIGKNCLVGAGTVITEKKQFGDNLLIIGSPARVLRELSEDDLARLRRTADHYVRHAQMFKSKLKRID